MGQIPTAFLLAALLALAGCASLRTPGNPEDVDAGQAYQASYRAPTSRAATPSSYLDAMKCTDRGLVRSEAIAAKAAGGASASGLRGPEVLSVGDLVQVFVEEDETFTGSYVVGMDGTVRLPFAPPVRAAGLPPRRVEADIARLLVREQLYDSAPRVSVILKDYAEAEVFVAGAVFEPRQVLIGGSNADTRDPPRQQALGAATFSRTLSAALRNAGGVRPDADLSRVTIERGGQRLRLDIQGAVTGAVFPDPVLIAGDRVVVPSRRCFQDDLMVPSSVTPPGVTVFLSNLTDRAQANAQAAVPDAREMRYGTRFLQAVFGLNCVGGSKLTNANRRAVLFSRNPATGESVVIDRSVEGLLRRTDRDQHNPYILPEDSMACYDSTFVSVRELAAAIGIAAAAIVILD